jgi:hypothetical protein
MLSQVIKPSPGSGIKLLARKLLSSNAGMLVLEEVQQTVDWSGAVEEPRSKFFLISDAIFNGYVGDGNYSLCIRGATLKLRQYEQMEHCQEIILEDGRALMVAMHGSNYGVLQVVSDYKFAVCVHLMHDERYEPANGLFH